MDDKDLDLDDRREAIQDYARKKRRGSRLLGIILMVIIFLIVYLLIYLNIFKF